jgi:hypothetical protein
MDGQAYILGIRAHLDGQRCLGDQIACIGADDAAAEDAVGRLALVAAERERAPRGGPAPLRYLIPLASFSVMPTQATSGLSISVMSASSRE